MPGWVKRLRPDRDGDTLCPVIDRLSAVGGLQLAYVRPELPMTLPRTVADVLADHVMFLADAIQAHLTR
jgi:hypothetical protein